MIAWLKRDWLFVAAALAIAAVVHSTSVLAIPRLVMWRATGLMARGTGFNTMTHAVRATWHSRTVVRPSPDLLYSSCPYDLGTAGAALHVHASGMPDTYWSVSVFDDDTDNVYVLNDRQAKDGTVDFLLVGPHTGIIDDARKNAPRQVWSPTSRGVVLFRTLIDDETRFAEIDAGRKHAACEIMGRP
jgi:uncharacterized membrane protein